MKITPKETLNDRKWQAISSEALPVFGATVRKFFPNLPQNCIAAQVTARGSSIDYGKTVTGWGLDQDNDSIPAGETRVIRGSYEYLNSLLSAGEDGVTTGYVTYFGAK